MKKSISVIKMSNMNKTNVMRFLDLNKINYQAFEYDKSITNGEEVAQVLNEDCNQVFKTLVTISNTKQYFVFCIPVKETLDLKKAAKAANVKSIEMIKQKELLPLTGYVHGGCSPLLMKKQFPTFIDIRLNMFSEIFISGGKVGYQIKIKISDLTKVLPFKIVNLT